MNEIRINITRTDVMTEVALASAYAGAKGSAEAASFSKVAAVKEDEEMLGRFWRDTCGEVAEVLKEFVTEASCNEDGFSLSLGMSLAYDTALTPSVERDLYSSIAVGVTGRWFRFTLPGIAAEWEERSRELLGRAHRNLCHRRKPKRNN